MFSRSYVKFTVFTLPFEWKVYRRYSEFRLLHETLIKMFPGCVVPPIPKKKA